MSVIKRDFTAGNKLEMPSELLFIFEYSTGGCLFSNKPSKASKVSTPTGWERGTGLVFRDSGCHPAPGQGLSPHPVEPPGSLNKHNTWTSLTGIPWG